MHPAVWLDFPVWHHGGLVLTSGGAGLNFYSGNNERASGLPASPAGLRDVPRFEEEDSRRLAEKAVGRPLREAEVSRYWTGRALEFIVSHPVRYWNLLGWKLRVLANGYEVPDNYHYAFMREHFVTLLYGTITFGIVGPFAIVGMLQPFWRRRQLTALYIVTLATLAPLLIFYVRSRYRIPAVPFLLVFGAFAVERLVRAVSARDVASLARYGGALLLAAIVVNRTYCEPPHHGFPAVCLGGDTWYDLEWLKLGEWYEARNDFDRAIAFRQRAAECQSPRNAGSIQFAIGTAAARSSIALADGGNRAVALERLALAEDALQKSVALRHRIGDAQLNRALALAMLGLDDRAREVIHDAARGRTLDGPRVARIASSLEQSGHCSGAVAVLEPVDQEGADRVRSRCASS